MAHKSLSSTKTLYVLQFFPGWVVHAPTPNLIISHANRWNQCSNTPRNTGNTCWTSMKIKRITTWCLSIPRETPSLALPGSSWYRGYSRYNTHKSLLATHNYYMLMLTITIKSYISIYITKEQNRSVNWQQSYQKLFCDICILQEHFREPQEVNCRVHGNCELFVHTVCN